MIKSKEVAKVSDYVTYKTATVQGKGRIYNIGQDNTDGVIKAAIETVFTLDDRKVPLIVEVELRQTERINDKHTISELKKALLLRYAL